MLSKIYLTWYTYLIILPDKLNQIHYLYFIHVPVFYREFSHYGIIMKSLNLGVMVDQ